MILLIIEPRMKQSRQLSGFGVQPRQICAFVQIAVMAGQRKIFRRVFSSMPARDDVFNVERQGFLALPQSTILAIVFRALPDQLAQLRVDQAALERMRRALACKIPMSVLAWT